MIWPAFILGLAGSLHCLGMCGPLALALPAGAPDRARFAIGRAAYNAGRIVTYCLLGVAFGAVGQTLAFAGWQRGLSIAAGIAMLAAAFASHRLSASVQIPLFRKAWSALLRNRGMASLFAIGLLNGLLPCGLVYVALAGAAATGSAAQGAVFMALFGMGTFPAMLAVALAGRMVSLPLRLRFQRAVPYAISFVAVLLILRGLDLGIPLVSPALAIKHSCCVP